MRRRPGIYPAFVTTGGEIVLPTDPGYHRARLKQPNDGGEAFAEDDPRLPELEQQATQGLLKPWRELGRRTLEALGLQPRKDAREQMFRFQPEQLARLLDLEARFVADAGGREAVFARRVYQAWLRGVTNAANELATDVLADEARERARRALAERGLERVKNGAVRRYRQAIVEELQAGQYDGLNPRDVARKLRRRFGAGEYNWERLARSEITHAQVQGKETQYQAEGITEYDYVTSGDSKVSAICRIHARTSPHQVGNGPLPVRNSHPNCRCTIVARVPSED